jgi:hypothetical protein
MEPWQSPTLSRTSYDDSRSTSPPSARSGLSWWQVQIMEALARLETGQVLNRKAGEHRVRELAEHMDDRMADLSHRVDRRMDRLEDRVLRMERSPEAAPTPLPAMPAPEVPASQPPGQISSIDRPWWREMSPREALLWLAVYMAALGVIPRETVEWLLKIASGPLAGVLPK